MNNWETEEKKSNNTIMKILISIIILVIIIIAIIIALLYYLKLSEYNVIIDGKKVSNSENFIVNDNNITYINIEELAGLLGCEYHAGEYKEFSSDTDKCYIQSEQETSSFYLNSNKVYKLPIGQFTEDYDIITVENNITQFNNKFYAPTDAVTAAFNVQILSEKNTMNISSLNVLLPVVDNILNKDKDNPEYDSLLNSEFNNQKAILYDYAIVRKNSSGLYSVLTTSGKEIVPDKYKSIQFIESTKEFIVTNSLGKIGILGEDGQNKIDQLYDSIKVINNNPKLYLVENNKQYGVIDENGKTIVYPEYTSIGIDVNKYKDIQNQYILLNKIIPVNKNNKYGLFNIQGENILDVIYDGIGCELTSLEINEKTKTINPIVFIKECNGIVIKSGDLYGMVDVQGKEMVPARVKAIYSITNGGTNNYYMFYNNEEINVIDRLIRAGVIQNTNEETNENINTQNNVTKNSTNNNIVNNNANTGNNLIVGIEHSTN